MTVYCHAFNYCVVKTKLYTKHFPKPHHLISLLITIKTKLYINIFINKVNTVFFFEDSCTILIQLSRFFHYSLINTFHSNYRYF